MFIGSVFLPAGLLYVNMLNRQRCVHALTTLSSWYGWAAENHAHWILPIIGAGVYGTGMMLCFLPIQVYFVDR